MYKNLICILFMMLFYVIVLIKDDGVLLELMSNNDFLMQYNNTKTELKTYKSYT